MGNGGDVSIIAEGNGGLLPPGHKGSFQWQKQLLMATGSSIRNGEARERVGDHTVKLGLGAH